jgi:hypothetical protein
MAVIEGKGGLLGDRLKNYEIAPAKMVRPHGAIGDSENTQILLAVTKRYGP